MGIYTNGSIFGIKIYNVQNEDDIINTLLEIKYDVLMNDEQKKEAYLFYEELDNKQNISFQIYTECSSTYGKRVYMSWYPISLNLFLENFGLSIGIK